MSWFQTCLLIFLVATLNGCGRSHAPDAGTNEKIEGPDVKGLSHEQIMAVLHECHRYGPSDDPQVKYTVRYCSAAQSAHAMEGYASAGPTTVDPTLNKLH